MDMDMGMYFHVWQKTISHSFENCPGHSGVTTDK
jgi:hypothetical protein